ncbi:MAG: hypothetical protein K2K55_03170 [Duncaniella sp.]|nr:hypothetical protein [Duncaniella sp.]
MADNYLEKKMEEHRSRVQQPARPRRSTSAPWVPQCLTFKFPDIHVFIPDATDSDLGMSLARLLRSLGVRVSVTGRSTAGATRFAQSTGCRYYPLSPSVDTARAIADLTDRRTPPDIIAVLPGSRIPTGVEIPQVSLPEEFRNGDTCTLSRLFAVLIHTSLSILEKNA